jgi:hypothetical protein
MRSHLHILREDKLSAFECAKREQANERLQEKRRGGERREEKTEGMVCAVRLLRVRVRKRKRKRARVVVLFSERSDNEDTNGI